MGMEEMVEEKLCALTLKLYPAFGTAVNHAIRHRRAHRVFLRSN